MQFDQNESDLIKKIIDLYRKIKPLIILAEEIDPEKRTLMSVFDQLRHSYDHFLRVFYRKIKGNNGDYIITNLNSSLSHLYRAGWDTLDWLNISYYELITDLIKKYHSDIIYKVIPEYYTTLRGKIESIKKEIAEYRTTKDIGNIDNVNFDNYIQKIERMAEMYELIYQKEISLIELEKERKREILKDPRTIIAILGISIAIISFICMVYFAIN